MAVTKSTKNAIITGVQRKFALKWMDNEAPNKQPHSFVRLVGLLALLGQGRLQQKQRAVPSSKAPTTSMLLSADPWPIGGRLGWRRQLLVGHMGWMVGH